MHHSDQLSGSMQTGLGVFFFLVMLMNLGFAWYWRSQKNTTQSLVWTLVAWLFLFHAVAFFFHAGWLLPQPIKDLVNYVMGPTTYFVGAAAAFVAVLYF